MPAKISDERLRHLASLYDAGWSLKKICSECGHSLRIVSRAVNKYSIMRPSTVGRTDTRLFKKLNKVSAYWLGFIAADGHIRFQPDKYRYELVIEINRKDEKHLDNFLELVGFGSKYYRQRDNCVIYSFASKSLVENLSIWLNVNNKTRLNNFDKIPGQFKRAFVRGYFDGDGSAQHSSMSITSCPQTIYPIANYIATLVGGNYRMYTKNRNSALSARWNKKETLKFREVFNGLPRLERKWNL